MPSVPGGVERRTRRRLARVRLENPGALPNVDPQDGFSRREARRVRARARQRRDSRRSTREFNPFAPLTGNNFSRELRAAERLEFGGRQHELRQAAANQQQTAANTGTYYDDYRQALREATARVNEANRQNVEATEARVDQVYTEDKAGTAARDAAATEAAAKLGRGPVASEEGARAVEAQRSQGNQAAALLRDRASSDNKFMEMRGTNVVLAKAQALTRENARQRALRGERRELAKDRGAFRTNYRSKTRESEREWAAITKEFGLKERELKLEHRQTRADRKLERQKLAAQRIVARMYASADRAQARAQIRVAQLQLEKGKISKSQFRTIRNIYEGLPNNGGSNRRSSQRGSGANGSLAPWEQDKITNAVRILKKNRAHAEDKQTWLKRMQDEGVPLRLARMAWRQYHRRHHDLSEPVQAPGPDGQRRPG